MKRIKKIRMDWIGWEKGWVSFGFFNECFTSE